MTKYQHIWSHQTCKETYVHALIEAAKQSLSLVKLMINHELRKLNFNCYPIYSRCTLSLPPENIRKPYGKFHIYRKKKFHFAATSSVFSSNIYLSKLCIFFQSNLDILSLCSHRKIEFRDVVKLDQNQQTQNWTPGISKN